MELLALLDAFGGVQLKEKNGCTASRRYPENTPLRNTKMFVPVVSPWIEESHDLTGFWIH